MASSAKLISSGLHALDRRYRTLTHNLANANTVGFKKRRSMFSEALAKGQAAGAAVPAGTTSQREIRETAAVDFSQGTLMRTGRGLDVALSGKGFFTLERPDGPALYTRSGVFTTDAEGKLTDASGRFVAGQGGPITIPAGVSPSQIQISAGGLLSVNGASVGRLRVAGFADESVLVPVGNSCFEAPRDDSVQPVDAPPADYAVHQGFREESNVTVVEELVDLITVTRLYEANLKSISSMDDRWKQVLDVAMK